MTLIIIRIIVMSIIKYKFNAHNQSDKHETRIFFFWDFKNVCELLLISWYTNLSMQARILIRHFFCANVSIFKNFDLSLRFETKPYFFSYNKHQIWS